MTGALDLAGRACGHCQNRQPLPDERDGFNAPTAHFDPKGWTRMRNSLRLLLAASLVALAPWSAMAQPPKPPAVGEALKLRPVQ